MIKQESIQNLKSIIDIVDVIGNYLQLTKAGSNYKALCPFHSEKTPSFVVSPAKQIYHCFGCGASGDAIKFIMEYEKLSYKEAIEKLAAMYNFPLEYTKSFNFIKIDLLEKVNNFYIENLYKNSTAYNYLKERGLFDSTIEKFQLGYAPTPIEQLKFFKNANLNLKDLKELGVITEKDYPRLIERITFPIFSSSGKIIAFGGRTIKDHPAKYINFSNTKLFNKSKTFYGLNFAREHILRNKEVIIVEGYMDVIMLHQAGIENTIATLGTALTTEHLPILKKLDSKITIAYDSDNAGINAAIKASKLLYQNFFEGGVVLFKEGEDPADAVKNNENINKIFEKKIAFDDFILNEYLKKFDIKNPIQKKKLIDEIRSYINTLPDILQDDFSIKAAQIFGLSPKIFKIKKNLSTQNIHKKIDIAEATIIKTLYENPQFLNEIVEVLIPEMFNTHQEELKLIYEEDFDNPKLLSIILRDDIKTYDFNTLKNQIRKLLIPYYQKQITKIRYNKKLNAEEKMHYIKEINLKIFKLKKGELVESNIPI